MLAAKRARTHPNREPLQNPPQHFHSPTPPNTDAVFRLPTLCLIRTTSMSLHPDPSPSAATPHTAQGEPVEGLAPGMYKCEFCGLVDNREKFMPPSRRYICNYI